MWIGQLFPNVSIMHQFVSAFSEALWSRHQFIFTRCITPLRILYFVLLIIVNDDLECKCRWFSLYTISFFISFFGSCQKHLVWTWYIFQYWSNTALISLCSLFLSIIGWVIFYKSGMMKEVIYELMLKMQLGRNTVCTIVLYLSSS